MPAIVSGAFLVVIVFLVLVISFKLFLFRMRSKISYHKHGANNMRINENYLRNRIN